MIESDEENMINNKTKKKSKNSNNVESENLDEDNGVTSDHDEVDHEITNDMSVLNDVSLEVEVTGNDETENDIKQALLDSGSNSGEISSDIKL